MLPVTDDWSERSRQLLAMAEGGDADAIGQLLELFRTYLTAIAGQKIPRELQPKIDPSDVVQDTFLEAARVFSRFKGTQQRDLRLWLRGILLNKLRDLHKYYFAGRRNASEREHSLDDSVEGPPLRKELAGADSTPSGKAARNEQIQELREALSRLPEEYRLVLVARNWEGLSFPEIGRRLQRSEDAARMLHLRALSRLMQVLRSSDARSDQPPRT